MSEALTFRQYRFCQRTDGTSIEINREDREVECLALDTTIIRFVSLHVMLQQAADPANFRERALEAQAISSVHHAQILQWGDDDDMSFYVTRFIDGATIPQYLRHLGNVPRYVLLNLARQVAALVTAASGRLHLVPDLALDHLRVVEVQGGAIRVVNTRYHLGGEGAVTTVISNDSEDEGGDGSDAIFSACSQLREHLARDGDEEIDGRESVMLLESLLGRGVGVDEDQLRQLGEAMDGVSPNLTMEMVKLEHLPPKTLLGKIASPQYEGAVPDHELVLETGRLGFAYAFAANNSEGESSYLQLLPGADVLPEEIVSTVQQSLDRVFRNGLPPRLLTLNPAVGESRMPFFSEQAPNGFDLETSLGIRGSLSLSEAALVLQEVEHALEQISGSRLLLPRLLPRDVYVVFEEPVAHDAIADLQARPLSELPKYSVRVRAHPTSEILADGWSFLPAVGASTAGSTATDQARFASTWAAQYYANFTFRLLGFAEGATEGEVRSREFPRALERLLLDCLPGKFRARPPIPPARLAERFSAAVLIADRAEAAGESGSSGFQSLAKSRPTRSSVQPDDDGASSRNVVKLPPRQKAPAVEKEAPVQAVSSDHTTPPSSSILSPPPEPQDGDVPEMGFAEVLMQQPGNADPITATRGLHGTARAIIREQKRRSFIRALCWILGFFVLVGLLYGLLKSGLPFRQQTEIPEWIGFERSEQAAPQSAPVVAPALDSPSAPEIQVPAEPEAAPASAIEGNDGGSEISAEAELNLSPDPSISLPGVEVPSNSGSLSVPKPSGLPIQ